MFPDDVVIFAKVDKFYVKTIMEALKELQNYTSLNVRIIKFKIYISSSCSNMDELLVACEFQ